MSRRGERRTRGSSLCTPQLSQRMVQALLSTSKSYTRSIEIVLSDRTLLAEGEAVAVPFAPQQFVHLALGGTPRLSPRLVLAFCLALHLTHWKVGEYGCGSQMLHTLLQTSMLQPSMQSLGFHSSLGRRVLLVHAAHDGIVVGLVDRISLASFCGHLDHLVHKETVLNGHSSPTAQLHLLIRLDLGPELSLVVLNHRLFIYTKREGRLASRQRKLATPLRHGALFT